jgi:uncharacterized repeat protein (TIGR04076 family)
LASLSKCKITVLRRGLDRELISEFLDESCGDMKRCGTFEDGQEFIVDEVHTPPDGFCSWAWADIRHVITRVAAGGDFPSMRSAGVAVACCTDLFRPVVFKIERME